MTEGEVQPIKTWHSPAAEPDLDFSAFFGAIAMASMLIRMQVIYNLATDEMFAVRTFRAYSAPARLRAIAAVAVTEWLEVS